MNTTSIQIFELGSKRIDVDRTGHTLSAFQIRDNDQLHPGVWEVHPGGDEILLMCSGAVDVITRHDEHDVLTLLGAGCGLVVPAGVWHRLALREPGLLITLTPRAGTRLNATPA
jgi:mannose-6-phosphate isomerase-like protein (cupin superfamily)